MLVVEVMGEAHPAMPCSWDQACPANLRKHLVPDLELMCPSITPADSAEGEEGPVQGEISRQGAVHLGQLIQAISAAGLLLPQGDLPQAGSHCTVSPLHSTPLPLNSKDWRWTLADRKGHKHEPFQQQQEGTEKAELISTGRGSIRVKKS